MIVTHPNNMGYLSSLQIGDGEENFHRICGIEIHEDSFMPERSIQEVWEPPQTSRFVTYGPEDESWMRPIGLGTVKQVDIGPLFIEMQDKVDHLVMEMLYEPFADDALFRYRARFLESLSYLPRPMMLNCIV